MQGGLPKTASSGSKLASPALNLENEINNDNTINNSLTEENTMKKYILEDPKDFNQIRTLNSLNRRK